MHYTTPSGDPLIHLAPDPVFMPNFPGWGFHRFNPWRQRFDEVIQRVIEAGLIDFWKQVAGLPFPTVSKYPDSTLLLTMTMMALTSNEPDISNREHG